MSTEDYSDWSWFPINAALWTWA